MRGKVITLGIILGVLAAIFLLTACETSPSDKQRNQAVAMRGDTLARAEAKVPVRPSVNFPVRAVLEEYNWRIDQLNHPWYTYILNDLNVATHYFVSTTVPVNSCAFLSSTEDVRDDDDGNLVLTAPSLDGIYYGGSGAAAACNGWIFIDAGTGIMGLAFGVHVLTYDAPLILETEPVRIQPVAPK